MEKNITIVGMVNIELYLKNLESEIKKIIKNTTYPEIMKYIEMLPKDYESDNSLFNWGNNFLNEYYKIIGKLDKITDPEIEKIKHEIYFLYLKENFYHTVFTYEEFITFSRLLNITFSDYNPNKTRKKDNEPFQSENKEINALVNSISYEVLHSLHPHAYEIPKFKLNILLNILNKRKNLLLDEQLEKIDLDDNLLNNILSEKRIKKLKKKRN